MQSKVVHKESKHQRKITLFLLLIEHYCANISCRLSISNSTFSLVSVIFPRFFSGLSTEIDKRELYAYLLLKRIVDDRDSLLILDSNLDFLPLALRRNGLQEFQVSSYQSDPYMKSRIEAVHRLNQISMTTTFQALSTETGTQEYPYRFHGRYYSFWEDNLELRTEKAVLPHLNILDELAREGKTYQILVLRSNEVTRDLMRDFNVLIQFEKIVVLASYKDYQCKRIKESLDNLLNAGWSICQYPNRIWILVSPDAT